MPDKNPNRGMKFRVERNLLMPHNYISGYVNRKRFQFIRNHPWISLAGAAAIAAFGLSFFLPKLDVEVTYHTSNPAYAGEQAIELPDSISPPEPYFPIEDEQITSSEPASALEEIASEPTYENTFNEEFDWDEYGPEKQAILEKQGVNKANYDAVREGRLIIKPGYSNN